MTRLKLPLKALISLLDNSQVVTANDFTTNSPNSSEHFNCWRVCEPQK